MCVCILIRTSHYIIAFAFINIHSWHKWLFRQKRRSGLLCFVVYKKKEVLAKKKKWSFMLRCIYKKKEVLAKKKKRSFMLRCVRKEGKVFFRLQLKILISSTSKRLNERVRIYYKV
jgi:hypothetical protein